MVEYHRLYGKEYRQREGYKDNMAEYHRLYHKEYRQREGYKDRKNKKATEHRVSLRLEILNHYSKGALTCARCGHGDVRALDLDHVGDNGGDHRKAIGRRGATYDIYSELKRNGFPDGYQILCRNCNWIKELERRSVEVK